MKKFILLLTIIIISIPVLAQDSIKVAVPPLNKEQIYADVKSGFTNLVNNLQGPAKHVYYVYVYQARAQGIASLCTCIFILLFGTIFSKVFYKNAMLAEDPGPIFGFVAGIIILLIGLTTVICFFTGDGFTQILNPEYFAIKDVISAFK